MRLGTLCSYVSRGRSPTYVAENGVPVVNQKCVRWGRVDLSHCRLTSPGAAAKAAPAQHLRDGDILWNSTGTGTIGRASILREVGGRLLADSHVTILRPEHALPRWIETWISSHFVQQQVTGTGSTNQVELSRDTVLNLPTPFVDADEQRRTVACIDELFAEIEEGERALAEARAGVETYRKALLKAAVTGELTADWRSHNNIAPSGDDLRHEIVDMRRRKGDIFSKADVGDVAFDVPSSWCWSSLGELFAIAVGATPNRGDKSLWNGAIPWVSSGEVAFSRIQDTREKISEHWVAPGRIHPIGTVMLGMIGEGRTRGQAAILDVAAAHNQNCASIRVSETPVPPEYVYWWLEYQYEKTRIESAGGNQPALNKARVGAISLPLPPREELTEIVARLTRLLGEASAAYALTDDVVPLPSSLKQSILAAAFRGELAA